MIYSFAIEWFCRLRALQTAAPSKLFALKAGLEIVFVGKLVAPRALGTILAVL